ncbi:hypothetical protein L4C36_20740 [Photobacterium japonica]|uniref:hypothetical protein n=1 Tax=Photobacterium japonica TaxID=2910235 RepID=UPI003D124C9E
MDEGKSPPNGGRQPKTVWRDSFVDEARQAVLIGCTSNYALSRYFGVSHNTIKKWREKYPEFDIAIDRAGKSLLSEVASQMLLSATEHKVVEEKVLSDGSIVQFKKTLPGNVRAQESLLRVLGGSVFGETDNPWDPKSKVELSGASDNPLAFILAEVAAEAENASPLPSKQNH